MSEPTKKFGKLVEGVLRYAPKTLRIGDRYVIVPREKDYIAAGYLPIKPDIRPIAPEGKVAVGGNWCEVDGEIVREYTFEDAPIVEEPPKRYSKLKLYAALAGAELWEPFEAWLKTQDFGGVNAYAAFMMANDLTSDHPLFGRWCKAAQEALGVDDTILNELLTAAEEDA